MNSRTASTLACAMAEAGSKASNIQCASVLEMLFLPINLNTASKEEIMLVPGMSMKMAHEFDQYRPYTSLEQFRREIGKYVDEDEVARLERYIEIR
jgi:predicted DNA-binding helix-hairpin-helix protein